MYTVLGHAFLCKKFTYGPIICTTLSVGSSVRHVIITSRYLSASAFIALFNPISSYIEHYGIQTWDVFVVLAPCFVFWFCLKNEIKSAFHYVAIAVVG